MLRFDPGVLVDQLCAKGRTLLRIGFGLVRGHRGPKVRYVILTVYSRLLSFSVYLPSNLFGLRFSVKAFAASWKSSVRKS